MIDKKIFNIKNLFTNIILFLFILVVFLNHTHNSIDPYYKINLKHNNENVYLKKENLSIKKDISENLISNKSYDTILNRECKLTGDLHDRHKVRWVKAIFLKNIFNLSDKIGSSMPYYVNILIHSLFLFLSLVLLNKTFSLDKKYILLFLIYIIFIFQQYLSEYSYSIFETFFLSLSLYASKNKKSLLFVSSCILAILNRESGFLILITWLIFNKDYRKFLFFSFICLIVFVLLNFDILKCLLNPKFFVPLESQKGQVNFSDLTNIGIFSISKLLFTNFILPFGLGIYYLIKTNNKNFFLSSLLIVYLLIFLFATPLHHISVRLVLIPLIFTAIYFYQKEKSSVNA